MRGKATSVAITSAFLLALSPITASAQAPLPGFTAGSFQVTESGAASYMIPIQAPPGLAGLEPKLSLAYNSQAGNGLMGLGWNLGGLSFISRCPRTVAQDGIAGIVNYTYDDRYCLDGQRLIAINGTDGVLGTQYRTERDTFSKIFSGAGWFKVWTKSGQILEYGLTADSLIEAQGLATTRVWAVNKISDARGNYLTVSYIKDPANGDYYPARIDYTGSTSQAPFNSIQFTYETRPDIIPAYQVGRLIRNTKRLIRIETYAGAIKVRQYNIAYQIPSPVSQVSRITECTGAGACLPALVFDNGPEVPTNFSGPGGMWAGHAGGNANNIVADFNGDGRADIMGYTGANSQWHRCHSTGSGFSCSFVTAHAGGVGNNVVGDFNGDGRADLMSYVGPSGSLGQWRLCLATTIGFNCSLVTAHAGGTTNNIVADFNGDGRADLMAYTGANSQWHMCLSTGTGFNCSYVNAHAGGVGNNATGDFNGDGRADIMAYVSNGQWHQCLSTGSGFNCSYVNAHGGGANNNLVGDFNGDGKADIMGYTGANSQWHMCLSTGQGFTCSYVAAHAGGVGNNAAGDFNGDGRADLISYVSNGQWNLCLATGSGFNCSLVNAHAGGPTNNAVGDYNGDGKSDLMGYASAGTWHVTLANTPSRLLQRIQQTGLGSDINITYAPLSAAGSSYTIYADATYPKIDLTIPLSVVTTVSVSNGVGGTSNTSYRYGGLKAEQGSGRGVLGFLWIENQRLETGITLRTEYRQDWPYTGLPSLTQKKLAGGGNAGVLSQTEYSYACLNPASGLACTNVAGNRYFPYASQTLEKSWGLYGATLPTTTTTNQYDTFGNPTTTVVTASDGYSKTTTNTYLNDTTNWFIGRLRRSSVQSTAP
ncbi:MAG: VCBS repeat-containing protein [Betaproteobacteria bacterium]|nr:VCBS repeat-containing protein [Betaproteobacteria bacterium]